MMSEQTLVLIKPDAVRRGFIGVILQRFEQAGFTIAGCKLVMPTPGQIEAHLSGSDEWIRGMGEKTLETYREYGMDPFDIFGTDDPMIIGLQLKQWNRQYLAIGPVLAMVLRGIHAVDTTRKLIVSIAVRRVSSFLRALHLAGQAGPMPFQSP